MTLGKFAIHFILVLAAVTYADASAAMAKDWSGVYTHDEESVEPDGSRVSYWFRLEVTDDGTGKFSAVLSNGANGKTTRHLQLNVKGWDTRAQFSYDHCLPLRPGKTETCTDEFKAGDELFAIEEWPVHCKYELFTKWQKLNLARQTESGEGDSRVFFKRYLG
ncbi:MAG: hypothetical protein ABI999_03615 [Acidobacteriota bacterium]